MKHLKYLILILIIWPLFSCVKQQTIKIATIVSQNVPGIKINFLRTHVEDEFEKNNTIKLN